MRKFRPRTGAAITSTEAAITLNTIIIAPTRRGPSARVRAAFAHRPLRGGLPVDGGGFVEPASRTAVATAPGRKFTPMVR